MAYKLATAYVDITSKSSGLGRGLAGAKRQLAAFGGAIAGIMGTRALLRGASEAIELAARQGAAETRLQAALKATGGAAGFTAKQLQDYASELQAATTFGDEHIMEIMATLTTFKSVSGDVFKRATQAALDLSATGFGSIEGASMQIAKALENPTKGMTALTRSGVTFTDQQTEQIKKLQASNNLYDAQLIVLEAVEGQVKGVSQAMAKTPMGRVKQLNNLIGDTKEKIGKILLPAYVKLKETVLAIYDFTEGWLQTSIDLFKHFWGEWKDSLKGLAGFWETYVRDSSDWFYVLATNWNTTWSTMKSSAKLAMLAMAAALAETLYAMIVSFDWFKRMHDKIVSSGGLFTIGKHEELQQGLVDEFKKASEEWRNRMWLGGKELRLQSEKQQRDLEKMLGVNIDILSTKQKIRDIEKERELQQQGKGIVPPPWPDLKEGPQSAGNVSGIFGAGEAFKAIQQQFLKQDPQIEGNRTLKNLEKLDQKMLDGIKAVGENTAKIIAIGSIAGIAF